MKDGDRMLLVLHAGVGKTGSSFLQSAFAKLVPQLAEHGVRYPEHDNFEAARKGKVTSGNGAALAKWLNPDLAIQDIPEDFLSKFIDSVSSSEQNVILYSSEFICRFKPEQMALLREELASQEIGLLYMNYFRSVAGNAFSNYSQWVKRNLYQKTLSDYIQTDYHMPFLNVTRNIVRTLRPEEFQIRNYDRVKDRLLDDFVENSLGIDADQVAGGAESKVVNRSLTPFEIELLRRFNGQLSLPRQSTLLSDALIYGSPEKVSRPTIQKEHLELLESRYSSVLKEINNQLPEEHHIRIRDEDLHLAEFEPTEFSDFEEAIISILSALVKKLQ